MTKTKTEKPIRMRAGYAGGNCEGCRRPINIGDIYHFMRDAGATVLCTQCYPDPVKVRKPK